jgi:selenocysteine-specific elongation factor
VKVHLGTAEVLARVALLEGDRLGEGETGWVQLRLEEAVLARTRDHLVIRSYSPVTTIGGGRVAEVSPRKRRRLSQEDTQLLEARLGDSVGKAVQALLETCGWEGVSTEQLPHRTGFSPESLRRAVGELERTGALVRVEEDLFSRSIWKDGRDQILEMLEEYHRKKPLRTGAPLEEVRQVVPGGRGPKLAEALLQEMVSCKEVVVRAGEAARGGFVPSLSEAQERSRTRLRETLSSTGLTPPDVKELAATHADPTEVDGILRLMEADGELLNLDGAFFFERKAIVQAAEAVVGALGGQVDLGPADFKEVLPVSRRHLLPILRYFDLTGVTTRRGDGRDVASTLPPGWGTLGRVGK